MHDLVENMRILSICFAGPRTNSKVLMYLFKFFGIVVWILLSIVEVESKAAAFGKSSSPDSLPPLTEATLDFLKKHNLFENKVLLGYLKKGTKIKDLEHKLKEPQLYDYIIYLNKAIDAHDKRESPLSDLVNRLAMKDLHFIRLKNKEKRHLQVSAQAIRTRGIHCLGFIRC
ncbi:hypothetical protein Plhal304r1_c010g0038571 [Plasmopara halstedii]